QLRSWTIQPGRCRDTVCVKERSECGGEESEREAGRIVSHASSVCSFLFTHFSLSCTGCTAGSAQAFQPVQRLQRLARRQRVGIDGVQRVFHRRRRRRRKQSQLRRSIGGGHQRAG